MQDKMKYVLQHVAPVSNTLGEGIVWRPASNEIFWLDVGPICKIFALNISSGFLRSCVMNNKVYCLRNSDDGNLVATTKFGLVWISPNDLTTIRSQHILGSDTSYRFNDANCDSRGRIWTGTMRDNFQYKDGKLQECDSTGQLYRIEKNGIVAVMDSGYGCPNTFAWSAAEKIMYCADSVSGWIYSYEFNAEDGILGARKFFYKNMDLGIPDGSAMDCEGGLWNARWDGSAVIRITADGKIDRLIKIPVSKVTDCVFAGKDLRTLYITTARYGMSDVALETEPLAGDVFAVTVDTPGIQKGYAFL